MKYYLIPFETDPDKMKGYDSCPKYLDEFIHGCNCLQPLVTEKNGSTDIAWRQKYYLVCVKSVICQLLVEMHKDVIFINKDTLKADLEKINIAVDKIPDSITPTRRDAVDKSVTKWLINEEKVLSDILTVGK